MKEVLAEVKEVRPGRQLFIREWYLGHPGIGDSKTLML